MAGESANDEQGTTGMPIEEADEQTKKRAAEAVPSSAQGPTPDTPNVALSSAQATDVARIEAATSAAQRLGSDHRTTLVKTLLDMDPDTRKAVRSEEHTSELQS